MAALGSVLVIFGLFAAVYFAFGLYDPHVLRAARWCAERAGRWFGLDCIALSRRVNAIARPLAVIFVVVRVCWTITGGGAAVDILLDIMVFGFWAIGRWCLWEPQFITRTEKERAAEMQRGSLSLDLHRELRSNRRSLAILLVLWCYLLLVFSNGDLGYAFATTLVCLLVACGLVVAYLLSIDQPPYEHVKVRDRLRVLFFVRQWKGSY